MPEPVSLSTSSSGALPPPAPLLPEWAPQAAVWVGWPHLETEWAEDFAPACAEIEGFVRTLARFVPVRMAAGTPASAAACSGRLGDVAAVHTVPLGDIWLRDTGPLLTRDAGRLVAHCFAFNGWGGKYVLDGDTGTAAAIAAAEGASARGHGFILEGGAIESDGAGTLLTTRACLLNPNRNAGWDEAAAEAALASAFGPARVIWLEDGLLNDHTDGHVDNIARFLAPGRVVCQAPAGENDPHAARLLHIEAQLRAAGLDVGTVPAPGRVIGPDGAVRPASHMNYLVTNGAVLVPTYGTATAGAALEALADLFADSEVIGLPAGAILSGGGAFHCMSQHVPAILQDDHA